MHITNLLHWYEQTRDCITADVCVETFVKIEGQQIGFTHKSVTGARTTQRRATGTRRAQRRA